MLFFRYLVFYSPFDVVYKVGKLLPFKMVICGLKEVQRASKVYGAVNHTAKLYPNAYIIIVLIGTIKGNTGRHTDCFTISFVVCSRYFLYA